MISQRHLNSSPEFFPFFFLWLSFSLSLQTTSKLLPIAAQQKGNQNRPEIFPLWRQLQNRTWSFISLRGGVRDEGAVRTVKSYTRTSEFSRDRVSRLCRKAYAVSNWLLWWWQLGRPRKRHLWCGDLWVPNRRPQSWATEGVILQELASEYQQGCPKGKATVISWWPGQE